MESEAKKCPVENKPKSYSDYLKVRRQTGGVCFNFT